MEEKSKDNTKKLLVIIIVLLSLIIIGMGGYLVYSNINNETETGENKTNNEVSNSDDKENNNVVEIAINNQLVQNLYNAIFPGGYNFQGDYFYHSQDKFLASDLDADTKISLLAELSSAGWKNNEYYKYVADLDEDGDGRHNVSKSELEDTYLKLFGEKMPKLNNGSYGDCPGLEVSNGNYFLALSCGDTGMPGIFQEVIKAEKTEDELYIYEIVAFASYLGKSNDKGQDILNLYRDVDKKILVSENEGFYHYDNTTINLSNIKDKLDTYKYTFKLSNDGTYYFYGVERVK